MTEAEKNEFQSLSVVLLHPSPTNPRKHFAPKAMTDLTASIKEDGIHTPLNVRQHPSMPEAYEIVSGERRFRAAKELGLVEVPCRVRQMTDAQALALQVVENLQREDVHPLEESEGFAGLIDRHGYTISDVAAKVGKPADYVAKRLKFRDLTSEKARKAFLAGELTNGVALALARIPDAKLQAAAADRIVGQSHWTPGQQVAFIAREYMLELSNAPFDTKDAELVPEAGPCTTCPFRTGNQAALFDDVKSKQVCTSPGCFKAKTAAAVALTVAKAEESGRKVIAGEAALKVKPSQYTDALVGHTALTDKVPGDPKHRTYKAILGKKAPEPVVLVDPHTQQTVDVLPNKALAAALKDAGYEAPKAKVDEKAVKEKAKAKERVARTKAVVAAFTSEIRTPISTNVGALQALRAIAASWNRGSSREILEKAGELPAKTKTVDGGQFDGVVAKAIEKWSLGQVVTLLVQCEIADQFFSAGSYPRIVETLAAAYSIDLKKLEKDYTNNRLVSEHLADEGKKADALIELSKPKPKTAMAVALAKAKPAKAKKKPTTKAGKRKGTK